MPLPVLLQVLVAGENVSELGTADSCLVEDLQEVQHSFTATHVSFFGFWILEIGATSTTSVNPQDSFDQKIRVFRIHNMQPCNPAHKLVPLLYDTGHD